jgi:hypothetical protein
MEIRGAVAWSKGLISLVAIMLISQQNIGARMIFFNHEWPRICTLKAQ